MPTKKKEELVMRLSQWLAGCTIIVVTDYRGLSVAELSELRRRLRGATAEYHVVKNSLMRLAAARCGKAGLDGLLVGPTAIAFGTGEIVQPAKVILEYQRSTRGPLRVVGGLLDGRILTAEEVITLASLPPRQELLARVVGLLQAPLVGLLHMLMAHPRALLAVLEARRRQLEGD